MEDEEIKTYSPESDDSVRLPIDEHNTGFEDVVGEDGLIATKLNQKVIIKRIAKDLYKNPASGLRELYNNSARACRVAVNKYGEKKPLITIMMNEEDHKLIIEDNGIGISKERFKKVLLELGTSDNLEAGEVGQFGMGFASYMTLSSVVIIDTHARATDEHYRIIAKDGMSFQPIGDTKMTGYGTRLEMTCYDTVSFVGLVEKIQKIVRYSRIPTVLELNGFEYFPPGFGAGLNRIDQFTFDEEVDSNHTRENDKIDIETEDFHLIGLVAGDYGSHNNDHIHLLNVPIESYITVPFKWWVLNIKNERKFKPMPDRDRMTEEADRTLESLIDKAIKKYFLDLSVHTYQQFLDSDRRNEFLWLCRNTDYAPQKMKEILRQVRECIVRKVEYGTKHFDDTSLVSKLVDNNDVIYQGYKNKGVSDKVMEFEPLSMLITTKKSKKLKWREHVEFMESFGIPTTKQILIDHKVKIPKSDKIEFELVGHTNRNEERGYGWYRHEIVDLDDIDENVIRVDSISIIDMIRYVKQFKNPYTFVRNATELDEYDCRDYSKWLKQIPNIMCATNKGIKSIKELKKAKEEVIFCTDFKEEFAYFFKDDERIVVYGGEGLLPMVLSMNPECKMSNDYSHRIPNEVNNWQFHQFVSEKYNVTLNSDLDKKFFCDNMIHLDPCFHTLFASLLKNTDYTLEDDKKISLWKDLLKKIQKFDPIEDDELARLRFYYGEEAKIADDESLLGETLQNLLNHTKNKIYDNEFLKARLLKEMILPKIFGHIEFRSMVKEQLSYNEAYQVSIATHDTEFHFKDEMEVYGFELNFRGCKMKINKGYCSIKVLVIISR